MESSSWGKRSEAVQLWVSTNIKRAGQWPDLVQHKWGRRPRRVSYKQLRRAAKRERRIWCLIDATVVVHRATISSNVRPSYVSAVTDKAIGPPNALEIQGLSKCYPQVIGMQQREPHWCKHQRRKHNSHKNKISKKWCETGQHYQEEDGGKTNTTYKANVSDRYAIKAKHQTTNIHSAQGRDYQETRGNIPHN